MRASLRVIIGGVIFVILAVTIGWFGFPALLHMKISKNVALRRGSEMREAWAKAPIGVEFKVYMFNITNPDEAAQGQLPIVQEIGPFFYYEWKEKVKIQDHPETDTVSFHMKNTFIFNETLSAPLTGNELITMGNAALLSMVYTVEREKPGAIGLVAKAIPHLFNQPKTPFMTHKAKDILFDGVPINCTSKDFATSAICTQIRADPKGLKKQSDDIFLFSFFGAKNGTADEHKLEVKRGVEDPQQVGIVVKVDDKEKMDVWPSDPCNTPRGTDSTIFAPFMDSENDVVAFTTDLCLSLGAKYKSNVVYKGIPAYRYTADFGDMSVEPEKKCFCPTPDTCLKKGLFDLTKCAGAPIIASLPHLYNTHDDYQKMVRGIAPDESKHEIYMNFEPMTATPLGARKRLQFNMFTHPVAKVPVMKDFCNSLMPLFWVEEGLDLGDDFINLLETMLFRTLRIVAVSKWIAVGIGCFIILGGILLHVYKRNSLVITPTTTAQPTDEKPSDEKY